MKLLTNARAAVQSRSTMYKAVVQTVLPYGSDIWVVKGEMLTVIEGFHHRLDRQIAGNTARHAGFGGWEWPPAEESLDVAGMWPIK